ncbi:hypothetical protein [Thermomonospora cellulosilytica]|uniref:Uncharacterized protein n=1 Tax=Thermomonospora cellulosilytica TaxID=1411118 RepID=A0A7W3R6S5_9ACTN|nr:hypothetical protein [Thermomonospora cellulosilytica]MBA9001907.1 hypothetical protein [Thermomonospora cellulosilytica]
MALPSDIELVYRRPDGSGDVRVRSLQDDVNSAERETTAAWNKNVRQRDDAIPAEQPPGSAWRSG